MYSEIPPNHLDEPIKFKESKSYTKSQKLTLPKDEATRLYEIEKQKRKDLQFLNRLRDAGQTVYLNDEHESKFDLPQILYYSTT